MRIATDQAAVLKEETNQTDEIVEAFKNFGIDIEKTKEERKEMNFLIYKKKDVMQDIINATGFKIKGKQKITIYCDEGYENILITSQRLE